MKPSAARRLLGRQPLQYLFFNPGSSIYFLVEVEQKSACSQVITLSHDKYELELGKIKESHCKSTKVRHVTQRLQRPYNGVVICD